MQTEWVKAASLVLDYSFYPRRRVNPANVTSLRRALEAGATLPPVIADRTSRRVSDGFHRVTASIHYAGPGAEIEVEWRDYPDDAALFEDAVRLNAHHGQRLTPADVVRCVELAADLSVSRERLADVICIRKERLSTVQAVKRTAGDGRRLGNTPLSVARRPEPSIVALPSPPAALARTSPEILERLIEMLEESQLDLTDAGLVKRLRYLALILDENLNAIKGVS